MNFWKEKEFRKKIHKTVNYHLYTSHYTLSNIENSAQEGKNKQARNFADKKKNMWYASDPSLVTMRMTIHPAVALQSERERHISQLYVED